jgi:drug/metabolite transporter (DMT)-like permease
MTRLLYLGLIGIGALWGLTVPLIKIASSHGHHPFALVFWQLAISTVVLGLILKVNGQGFRWQWRDLWFYLLIAVIGTLIPNSFSFRAAVHLPAGIIAMGLAMVPMFAMPVALAMRNERAEARRFVGLGFGAVAVVLILAPEAALPAGIAAGWVLVALVAPFCYGFEGNAVAKLGTGGLTPIQVIFGASFLGMIIAFPFATADERWINLLAGGVPGGWAITLNGVLHGLAYSGYVALVGRAGPVFSSQVAYVVTGFAVLWSMLLLGERYSLWVWAAFAVLFFGLILVQPRPKAQATQPA